MPSHVLHQLAGIAALESSGLSGEVRTLAAFNLGCQGPDLFSHNRRTKPLSLAFARLLHRRDYGRFCANLCVRVQANPSEGIISWLYGFVTHQVIDRLFHPYIVNRSFVSVSTGLPSVTPAHFHAFLERVLDTCFFEAKEGRPISSFDTTQIFDLDRQTIPDLSSLIAAALTDTFPDETAGDGEIELRVANAFSDTLTYYDIANPAVTSLSVPAEQSKIRHFVELGIAGVALLHPEQVDTSVDWLNASHEDWLHPVTGAIQNLSVFDLFDEGVLESAEVVRCLRSTLAGEKDIAILESLIGNSVLSVVGPDGTIGKVEFSQPFDIKREMRAQVDKRRLWLSGTLG